MYPVLNVDELTTPQQVFDAVAAHLRDQGKQSISADFVPTCRYRVDSLACAAGCLLTDKEATLCDSASSTGKSIIVTQSTFQALIPRLTRFIPLLRSLQQVHDFFPEREWFEQLRFVAKSYALTVPTWLKPDH